MRDSGLQPERTDLAWSRTSLLALLTATLSIRVGISTSAITHIVAALLLAALAGAMWHRGKRRSRYTSAEEVVTRKSRRLLIATSVVIAIASIIHSSLIFTKIMKQLVW